MNIRGMVSQVGTESETDIQQLIRAGLEHYVEPGKWTEIRTFQPTTESRWFSDLDAAASYALGQSKRKDRVPASVDIFHQSRSPVPTEIPSTYHNLDRSF